MSNVSDERADADARRLAALARYEVLGTPPEATFDRVVSIIAAVFDVPIAMITLVDQEQCWYKAEIGMGVPSLPRADNMCDVVMAQDGVLVIDDANTEPPERVRPLLQRGMRGYIGAPLRTRDGVKIGTVCAVDLRPRTATEREKQILTDLADIVVDELELRLAARQIHEADERLRHLNHELEAASRNKSEFLASMSHELRTPLNGVMGAAELLEQGLFGELNEKQQEYVRDIRQSGAHLLGLIDEVLDLSRVESGQISLRCQPLKVAPLMESSAAFVRGFATAKSLTLDVMPPHGPVLVHADERRLTQVLCNLLSNAIKFTPAGGRVAFDAWQEDSVAIFRVTDEGPGVPEEFRDRIFEQFFRVPSDQEGTGLGLPLAKRLIEAHGGSIWLADRPGRGTCFHVSVPLSGSAP